METLIERCCGLDVHQATVVACLLIWEGGERPRKEVRTFGTMTADLKAMAAWLKEAGCTHIGMESTGVYWMPVYAVLEQGFKLVVGNAAHIKNVPGRKTDVKDSEWIADLLRHGLIRSSFVPGKEQRELRDLTRYRRKLMDSQASERNRLIKLLEGANIKLASVASNVFGVSGRLIVRALIAGTATPEMMAKLAKGKLRSKTAELALALDGRIDAHHRFLLEMQLERVEQVEASIGRLDERIDAQLEPVREIHTRLMQIPGIDWIGAAVIVAELGVDMTVFPTPQQAAAWAGVAPGNNRTAGKRRAETSRRGNIHLTTALVQAAMAAARKRGSYFKEKYWRLKAKRGPRRAAMAVAHKILIAAYHMLKAGTGFHDLGGAYLDKLVQSQVKNRLVHRLEQMGYAVTLDSKGGLA